MKKIGWILIVGLLSFIFFALLVETLNHSESFGIIAVGFLWFLGLFGFILGWILIAMAVRVGWELGGKIVGRK